MIRRVLTIPFQPDKVGRLGQITQQSFVSAFERLLGLRGGWWMVNEAVGKAIQITLWDSEEDIPRRCWYHGAQTRWMGRSS